jgi:hypothetical protein
MAVIVNIVFGGGVGIEPMAPMVALSTVVAVDGGGNDGIFTTTSYGDDCHPCPHRPCPRPPLDKNQTAGWRVRHDTSHSSLPWLSTLTPSPCLHLRDYGAKDDGRGDR